MGCVCLTLCSLNIKAIEDDSAGWQALGRQIFEDQKLSRDRQIACASCHQSASAMADNRPQPIGLNGVQITRNAPSLLGLRHNQPLFWDGRRQQLSQAVLDPFLSRHEHAFGDTQALVNKVADNSDYQAAFNRLTESESAITSDTIAAAISAYLLALPSATSLFDRWLESPEATDISPAARQGYELFTGRAGCSRCHVINTDSAPLTDDRFHNHGVSSHYLQHDLPMLLQRIGQMSSDDLTAAMLTDPQVGALGRFLVTGAPTDIGAFRTPSLRNVMRTAPYMHDGSIASIQAAVDHELYYSAADHGAGFSLAERQAIVEFLTLLDDLPVLPESAGNDL